MMYIKAEQRAKSIGGFIRDEMMIAMGDVPWIYKKVYLVSGSTLNGGVGRPKEGSWSAFVEG